MKPLVLISGGAGFIGSHTADLLLKKGYRVRILDNLSPKTHYGKWPNYLDKRIEKIKGDVRRKSDWLKALKGADYVIHLAAWMDLLPEFSKFFSINVVGTANLYEVILENKLPVKKVVVASSQFVYGQGKWKCKKHGFVFPNDRSNRDLEKGDWDPVCPECGGTIVPDLNTEDYQNPPNQYAISKYTQEIMALKLGKLYGIPSTALRYSIVHGSRQSVKNVYSGALRTFAIQIINGDTPLVFEDGNQLRDYVSVKDVAAANVLVMKKKASDYKVYNVGGGKGYSVKNLITIINDTVGVKDALIKPSGFYRAGDIRHAVSSVSKLTSLGWRVSRSEKANVKDFIDWIKANPMANLKLIEKTKKSMIRLGVLKKKNEAEH